MLEQYLTSPKAIWTIFFATAAFSGFALDAVVRFLWRLWIRSRTIVVEVPELPGEYVKFSRVKKEAGGIWSRKKGDEGTNTILSGDAGHPSNWGPVNVIDKNGFNLVAPTKDSPGIDAKSKKDIKADPETFRRFRIWDHLIYWRACRENDMEDLYSAQKEKDHWAIKAIPVVVIFAVCLLGFLCFAIWKILPLLKNAGG